MKVRKKLKDLTYKEYNEWLGSICSTDKMKCKECPLRFVDCCLCDNCWFYHKDLCSEKFLNQEIEFEIEEKTSVVVLSESEKVILKNIDKNYEYIARDANDNLYVFYEVDEIFEEDGRVCKYLPLNNLFHFIRRNEMYLIKTLLKGDMINHDKEN